MTHREKKRKAWHFFATFATIVFALTLIRETGRRCSDSGDIVTADGAVEIALFAEARYRYGTISPDEAGIREFFQANPDCCHAVIFRRSVIDKLFKRAPKFDIPLKYLTNREMEKFARGKFYEATYIVDGCGKIRERHGGFSTS